MKKSILNICLPKNTPQSEIGEIRAMLKKECGDNIKINMIISGCEEPRFNITEFIKARN